MANRPANAGAHSAGPQRGPAATPPPIRQDAPPPVHHQGFPRNRTTPARPTTAPAEPTTAPARPRTAPGRRRTARARPADADRPAIGILAWLPYLIVLAGVAVGMFVVWLGSKYAGPGTAIVGCSLLAGALFRLVLPARDAGLLSSRRKASDVLAFAAFGAAVLAVAIALP